MKTTFKELLETTYKKNQSQWNYYSSGKDFNTFPLNSVIESKSFIKSFFQLSGKAENKLSEQIDKIGQRSVHIVSAFLLGHYLYQNTILKDKIDNEIKKLKSNLKTTSEIDFSFMWFLICLFHDIGYNIENNKTLEYKSVEELIKQEKSMPKIVGVPKFYNMIYKNYFNYRTSVHNKNDHGITAGFIMYNELCKIRELAEYPENTTNLKWEKDLELIYSFCTWNITAHNIWFGKNENAIDAKNYKKFKIKRLLFDGKYKIKSNKYPFFFLFCLTDTIEPYKRVLDFNPLNNIELEILTDKIIITSNLNCSCGNAILKQAEDLNKWLTKTTKKDNTVEILLKHKTQ